MCEKKDKVRILCNIETTDGFEKKLIYTDSNSLKTGNIEGYKILDIIEVMECSGYKDKHGCYIYVGDVIRRNLNKGFFDVGDVTFEGGEFWMNFYGEPCKQNLKTYMNDLENVEIIDKVNNIRQFNQ